MGALSCIMTVPVFLRGNFRKLTIPTGVDIFLYVSPVTPVSVYQTAWQHMPAEVDLTDLASALASWVA